MIDTYKLCHTLVLSMIMVFDIRLDWCRARTLMPMVSAI